MEPSKQLRQRERLSQIIAVTSILLLLINCSSQKNQEYITSHNLKIIDTVIKKVCNRWKNENKEDYKLHLINFSDEGFSRIFEHRIMTRLKKEPKYKGIFSEKNIQFFKEQLNDHPDGYYTDLLPRNDCYIMKDEILQEEQIPPPIHWPQDYMMSKVVFTKDFEYALFVAGKNGYGLDIYKFEDGNYRPFESIYLAVF